MRLRGKTDDNQNEIVLALREAGCQVLSLAALGAGVPDLLVLRGLRIYMLEVKDGSKSVSRQRLTPDQVRFHALWPVVKVVTSVEEALAAVGAIACPNQ